jgi:hypothetical protein
MLADFDASVLEILTAAATSRSTGPKSEEVTSMVRNPILISPIRRRAAFAMILATACAVVASSANAQRPAEHTRTQPQLWRVSIIVDPDKDSTPTYSISPSQLGYKFRCSFDSNPSADQSVLYVCPGDTVEWIRKYTNGSPLTSDDTYLYHETPVLIDDTGGLAHGFHGHAASKIRALVDPEAPSGTEDKYSVSVFDETKSHIHRDDPKIIIGGGGKSLRAICLDLEYQLGELSQSQNQSDLEKRAEDLEKKVEKVCVEIGTLASPAQPK